MKYLKATWIGSAPGGHVSMTGFEEVLDELVRNPQSGARIHRQGSIGKGITVTPCMDDGDEEQKHPKTKERLLQGEFMVQETPKNMKTLKSYVKMGFIQMADWNLHYELLEEAPREEEIKEEIVQEDTITEIDVSPKNSPAAIAARKKVASENMKAVTEEINAENKEAVEALSVLTSVKVRKSEIIAGIIDKGIKTMENLASTDKAILLAVNFIGDKVADNILQEAQKLSGGSKEE